MRKKKEGKKRGMRKQMFEAGGVLGGKREVERGNKKQMVEAGGVLGGRWEVERGKKRVLKFRN